MMASIRRRASVGLWAPLVLFGCGAAPVEDPCAAERFEPPPEARAGETVDRIHGVEVRDPYRWLEDRESPDTESWLRQQREYATRVLASMPGADEIRSVLIAHDRLPAVRRLHRRGQRFFYMKEVPGRERPVICMREGFFGDELILVDPATLGDDASVGVFSLNDGAISPDGRYLAYYVQRGGEDETEARVLDVERREEIEDRLPKARYFQVVMRPDNSGFFYSQYLPGKGFRILRHGFGEDVRDDPVVFGEDSTPDQTATATLSEDGRWLLVQRSDGAGGSTALFLRDLESAAPWQTVIDDGESKSSARFVGSSLLIRTDRDAPNGRLVRAALDNPHHESWREIVGEHPRDVLTSALAAGDRIVVNYLSDVRSVSRIFDGAGAPLGEVPYPNLGTAYNVCSSDEGRYLYYIFSSFHMKPHVYRYSLAEGRTETWRSSQEPASEVVVVEQVFVESTDDTRVPLFLVHRKGFVRDGTAPTLLFGYGGFGSSQYPIYDAVAATWVEMGGLYVLANIRGGGEYGTQWHEQGKLLNKQRSFDDFISAAEHLIDEGFTSSAKLGIMGGSNGGLLVNAVMAQRPKLFGAVVSYYAALDMIRYHLFPPADWWVGEYGSADDPEQFRNLIGYSPYHNIRDGVVYPATLLISGDGDTRVNPLHSRKMTAMLQARSAGGHPIVLLYHDRGGHSGGLTATERRAEAVNKIRFLACRLGLPLPRTTQPER